MQCFSSGKLDYSSPNELPPENSTVAFPLVNPNGPGKGRMDPQKYGQSVRFVWGIPQFTDSHRMSLLSGLPDYSWIS